MSARRGRGIPNALSDAANSSTIPIWSWRQLVHGVFLHQNECGTIAIDAS